MKTPILIKMREWLFPVVVLAFWAVGFTYTLTQLGEAHRTRLAELEGHRRERVRRPHERLDHKLGVIGHDAQRVAAAGECQV